MVLTHKYVAIHTRRRAVECYIKPILIHDVWMQGPDNFKISTKGIRSNRNVVPLENVVSWTAKKSNKTVLREADTTRSLVNKICKCWATFFGHVTRREILECLVATRIIQGNAAGENREKGCQME